MKFLIFITFLSLNVFAAPMMETFNLETNNLSDFVLPNISCSSDNTKECYKETVVKLAKNCKSIDYHLDCDNYKAYPKVILEDLPPAVSRTKAMAMNHANRLTKKENVINAKTRKTNIHLAGKYTEYVYIRIHGVWRFGILDQSKVFKTIASSGKPINVIEIILPGHGKDMKKAAKVSYKDWVYAVDKAILLANNLGKKVIIESHSMGGLLGSMANINWPNRVAGNFTSAPAYGVSHYSNFASTLPKFLKGEIIGLDGLNANLGRQTIALKNLVWRLYDNDKRLPSIPWIFYSTPHDQVVSHFDAYIFSLLIEKKGAYTYFKHIDGSKDGIMAHVSKNVMFGDKPMYSAGSIKRNYAQEFLARFFNFCEPGSFKSNACVHGKKTK